MFSSMFNEFLMPIINSIMLSSALEDMKQRLRFLRRRHTDSSIESSVRPSKEELEKWANSFIDLMSSRYGSALFRAFLSREFSEENIEFWMACEEFKKSRQSKLTQKARKIFDDFLAVKAPKEHGKFGPKAETINYANPTDPGP
ncbi:unnamed protein product [Oppiella nova]|uniref:RGS domain-containing protein n=1 Tax=Oppiella nova TaxID=334625 RepID=A0A7R9LI01_9ACAR|nr:unnamed protein product [Oppiella nova]CAG2163808.1 unnamed protein product [Oppiella nova]